MRCVLPSRLGTHSLSKLASIAAVSIGLLGAAPAVADDAAPQAEASEAPPLFGYMDLNAYYDVRGFSTYTVNLFALMPKGVSYFSFVDFNGAPAAIREGADDPLEDVSSFYSQHNLYWGPARSVPLDLHVQWVLSAGTRNDSFRVGFRWSPWLTPGLDSVFGALNAWYTFSVHPLNLNSTFGQGGWHVQLEHVYRIEPFREKWNRRIYISGFMDHYMWLGAPDGQPWSWSTTQHQIGLRVIGNLHIVGEFRHEFYFKFADTDGDGQSNVSREGFGAGLEYVIPVNIAMK